MFFRVMPIQVHLPHEDLPSDAETSGQATSVALLLLVLAERRQNTVLTRILPRMKTKVAGS